MTTGSVGVALFGLGRAGRIHFKNALSNPRCQLKYIVEKDTVMAQTLMSQHHLNDVKVIPVDQADTVYNDSSIGAVFVCSPTYTHEEIVKAALEHGKGVFCEKPISQNVQGICRCFEAAEKVGVTLLCSFNRRFDPSICGMRARITGGDIGRIHLIKTCSRDHPLPEMNYLSTSDGIFHDCAIHDLDFVCWILGEYPVTVYTQAHVHDEAIASVNDVDTVVIVMKFSSGVISIIELGRHATYGYDQRIEVNGSKGMLTSENHLSDGIVQHTNAGITSSTYKYSFSERYAQSYIGSVNHFFNILEGSEQPMISKQEVVRVSLLATACDESYRTGLPVTVNYS